MTTPRLLVLPRRYRTSYLSVLSLQWVPVHLYTVYVQHHHAAAMAAAMRTLCQSYPKVKHSRLEPFEKWPASCNEDRRPDGQYIAIFWWGHLGTNVPGSLNRVTC